MSAQAIGGTVALVGASAIHGLALSRLRRFEAGQRAKTPWWFGYARDGVNLGAFAAYLGAYVLAGFHGPAALVAAVALLLAGYIADWTFGRRFPLPTIRLAALAAVAAIGAASAFSAPKVEPAIDSLICVASPRWSR